MNWIQDNKWKLFTALMGLIVLFICAVIIYDWSAKHKFQSPISISVETKPLVIDREPEIVISPLAKEQEKTDLTGIDKKIYDAFGVENYRVMRAIAVCESGMNPNAVNWETRDLGLYQINYPIWADEIKDEFGYTLGDMFDVDKNIEVAKWIWDRDGNGEGKVTPWVATNTSCFREEL